MQYERDQRNLLGIFDLISANVNGQSLNSRQLLVYRDFVVIDEANLVIPFSKMKEIKGESNSNEMTLRIDYKNDEDKPRILTIIGMNDNGPSSLEYCEIMIARGIMSSHIPIKNKDKACYGILGY